MRVLHIVESFAGGVLTSVTQLCNVQAIDGYDVFLAHSIRPGTPVDYQRLLDPAVKIKRIELVRHISPYHDLCGLLKIIILIKQIDPDIIHLHSSKAGFLGRLAVFCEAKKGRKIFYSPRGFSFLQLNIPRIKRFLYYSLEKLGVLFGGTIVACSQGEADVAEKLKARSVVLLENAVDTDIVPVRIYNNENRVVQIGTLGRLCPQKNPDLFKELATAFESRDDMQFVWVGGGEGESELSGLVNLQVTGWLPRQDALEVLGHLDIYVQTSLWEGMPISVIEAQVAGIPVVVTNVLGNRDIVIQGETGYIADSLDEMVRFIELLGNEQTLRQQMGERARLQSLDRFSLHRLRSEINQLYQKAQISVGKEL